MKAIFNIAPDSLLEFLRRSISGSVEIDAVVGYISYQGLTLLGIPCKVGYQRVRILVGMATESGLPEALIAELAAIDALLTPDSGGIRYAAIECHSKFWTGRSPSSKWSVIGSSNLSRAGLYERREANICDSDGVLHDQLGAEFESLWSSGLPIALAPVAVIDPSTRVVAPATAIATATDPETDTASVTISLLGSDGEVHGGDGLNWWRDSRTGLVRRGRPNEACIPVRKSNIGAIEAVLGAADSGVVWHASTQDGAQFDLVLQGTGAGGRAKQIASAGDLQAFGRWILRTVLGLSEGTAVTAKILRSTLGTTALTVTRLGIAEDGNLRVHLSFEPESTP